MAFLEKSLNSALNFFKEAVFSEEIARKKGLLQACDPRLKAVSDSAGAPADGRGIP